ncbi:MAG TPA: VOC family protein [Bacteroidota bacterium]|nr:VOC family protein [Bacteroidota bacterium]
MERVTGIGGVFFKGKEQKALLKWYEEFLGIPVESYGGHAFTSLEAGEAGGKGTTVWGIFPATTEYMNPGTATFMINYRVKDLDAILEQLRRMGANVLDAREESEQGRFGWVIDPEGNKIELWEPPPEVA